MFSGIVECIGKIISAHFHNQCLHLKIKPAIIFDDIKVGDSIAINGICLTVTEYDQQTFDVTAVPETLRLTNLANFASNDFVNLERALKVGDRMGGHFVQGHVDCIATITSIQDEGDAKLFYFDVAKDYLKYIAKKGFITIDGMSITLVDVSENGFAITLIPHTIHATIAKKYQINTKVNIEVDILAKYIEKIRGEIK